jgi:hypothetical protein
MYLQKIFVKKSLSLNHFLASVRDRLDFLTFYHTFPIFKSQTILKCRVFLKILVTLNSIGGSQKRKERTNECTRECVRLSIIFNLETRTIQLLHILY